MMSSNYIAQDICPAQYINKGFSKMDEMMFRLSEKIYNTCIVLDTFCKNKKEYEEIQNISPIIEFIKDLSDKLHMEIMGWDK